VRLHEAYNPYGDTRLERKIGSGRNSLAEVPEPPASPSQRAPLETIRPNPGATRQAGPTQLTPPLSSKAPSRGGEMLSASLVLKRARRGPKCQDLSLPLWRKAGWTAQTATRGVISNLSTCHGPTL
jgi:hypothetical protein